MSNCNLNLKEQYILYNYDIYKIVGIKTDDEKREQQFLLINLFNSGYYLMDVENYEYFNIFNTIEEAERHSTHSKISVSEKYILMLCSDDPPKKINLISLLLSKNPGGIYYSSNSYKRMLNHL